MNIIKRRKIFLILSGILVLLSIIVLLVFGLKFSIDFKGGTRLEVNMADENTDTREKIEQVYNQNDIRVNSVQQTELGYRISSSAIDEATKDQILNELDAQEQAFEVLGPVIGGETRNKAVMAVFLAIVAITIYIAVAFWKSGGVISSWKFGITAIIALVHDVIITLGAFSIFGVLFGVEIDSLFVTAILTIIGFSVHDTIVVFDRIRENIKNNVKHIPFEQIVGNSITETVARSLGTSILVLLVLFSMAIFGGESIRWFVIAFIIGVVVGAYSSIFVASPILLEWYKFDQNGGAKTLRQKLIKPKKK